MLLTFLVAFAFFTTEVFSQTGIAYLVYFSDNECSQLSGIKGYNSNDPYQITRAATTNSGTAITCEAAMACFFQPEGQACRSLDISGAVANVEIEVRGNDVFECDDSNVGEECTVIDPVTCSQSSVYNCYFRWVSSETLEQNPGAYLPSRTTSTVGLNQYSYLAYYSDDDCSELAGIRGFVSGDSFQIPRLGANQDISCDASMPCFLQPDGSACGGLLTGTPANVEIENRQVGSGIEVYECDSSNVGEPECDIIEQGDCRDSSSYNCNFFWVTADSFSRDPVAVMAPYEPNPDAEIAYLAYFSDSGCTQLAGLKGYPSNDPYQITRAATSNSGSSISCEAAMACFFQPDGQSCRSLDISGAVANAEIEVRGNDVFECDDSNTGSQCTLINSATCNESSVFNCYFRWVSSDTLKQNPEAYIPPRSGSTVGLNDYSYLVYYADDDCDDLAGIRAFVSGNPFQIPRLGANQNLSCEDSMACFLLPEGRACGGLLTGSPADVEIENRESSTGIDVYECDSSNVGEPECDIIDQGDCRDSSSYNCNFFWVTAGSLATDPESVFAPFDPENPIPDHSTGLRFGLVSLITLLLGFFLKL